MSLEVHLPQYCMDGCGKTLALNPLTDNEWLQIKAFSFEMWVKSDRELSLFGKCLKCGMQLYYLRDVTNPQHSFCIGLPK